MCCLTAVNRLMTTAAEMCRLAAFQLRCLARSDEADTWAVLLLLLQQAGLATASCTLLLDCTSDLG